MHRNLLALLPACLLLLTGPALAQNSAHLPEAKAKALMAPAVLEYKLKDFKVKKKSDAWQEYSATYKTKKSSPKELKLVVNHVLPNGDAAWEKQFAKPAGKLGDLPYVTADDGEKRSVLVLVDQRYRVDFKSRQISAEKLLAMAKSYDFANLRTPEAK